MPNIIVKIPCGSFPGEARDTLAREITEVVSEIEQVGDDVLQQAVTWVVIEEMAASGIRCGGNDLTDRMLPCIIQAYIPSGVLDGASRAAYVAALDAVFQRCKPESDSRHIVLSTLLLEVPEGHWGARDVIWRLPDFADAAGFKHLQMLVPGGVK